MQEYYSDLLVSVKTDSANTIIDQKQANEGDFEGEDKMELKVRSTINITLKKEL